MWALPGPHLGSSSPARRASPPTRRRRPPSRPSRRGSRRALRGIRPSGAVRLYADRAFLIPASRRPRSLASAALAERAETLAGIRRVLGSKPGLRFCRFGRGFAVISGYFWLFLAISGLGASPGGPGSKLIILRATGESQESALLPAFLVLLRDPKNAMAGSVVQGGSGLNQRWFWGWRQAGSGSGSGSPRTCGSEAVVQA